PELIHLNTNLPRPVLTNFEVFDKKIELDTAIERKKTIVLPYSQNTVSFEFAGLEYSDPGQNQYASKLEGLENKWFYSGNKRFVRYSGLKPGTYHLWVKASNN